MGLGAQAAVPDAGQLLNEQQRLDKSAVRPAAAPVNVNAQALDTAAAQPGLRARIERVRVSGADGLLSDAQLQALLVDAKGRTLNHAQLQQLASRVTMALQAAGYPLARAYLPRQDLSAGDLEIAVMAGRLQTGPDRVKVMAADPELGVWLAGVANAALPEGTVRSEQLERALLLISEVPGVQSRASLEKGKEPGSSRLLVRADTPRDWSAQATLDSFGNRYTGDWRAGAQAALYRPFGNDDLLGLGLSHSRGSDQASASYALGLNPQGLRAQFSGSWMRYQVGADAAALNLTGTASTLSAGLAYPLLRARERNLNASFEVERKGMSDKALGQEIRARRVHKASASLNGSFRSDWLGVAYNELSAGFAVGQLDLDNSADRLADSLSARTAGGFSKVYGRAARTQGFEGAPDWSLFMGASAQLAGRNLDSSEKFILGGAAGVRGQASGEASGDSGWLLNLEVRRELQLMPELRSQLLAFVDYGRITQQAQPWAGATPAGRDNGYALSGAGVGVNLYGERWSLRSAWAHALGSNPGRSAAGLNADGRSSRNHLWVQASLRY
ncbi:MAG: ShlB/FhaC/HecB family hemolysin secretion/activation protein [Methylibium sp.]|nr:ShlB/FhaC/HecB family hemolysin secretion/activation protein [Methylibium sp.]